LFNLGSISKTFVSNAILMLRAEGKLSLEDSLAGYFPGFKRKEIAERVKIRHLLTHSSGLPDNRGVSKNPVFYLTAKDAENWFPVTQTESVHFAPGSAYEYSNPAFNALALIIEQVTGAKWQRFIEGRIFRPSGMVASTITDGPHPESGVSHGYTRQGGAWAETDYGEEPTFPAAGNGGVWSSVDELFRYEMALERGVFLSRDIVADSRRVKIETGHGIHGVMATWVETRPPSIGWSWFIDRTADGLTTVGHAGTQGGFECNYVTVPDRKIFFALLCNYPCDVGALSDQVMTRLRERNWLEP
jgi:CubicO group peptidase (beta-lactamase class C family)